MNKKEMSEHSKNEKPCEKSGQVSQERNYKRVTYPVAVDADNPSIDIFKKKCLEPAILFPFHIF